MCHEGVFCDTPPLNACLNVQVNVFPSTLAAHVMQRFTRNHLRHGSIFVQIGLGFLVSHPLKFKRWVIFIFIFSKRFGEFEEIFFISS